MKKKLYRIAQVLMFLMFVMTCSVSAEENNIIYVDDNPDALIQSISFTDFDIVLESIIVIASPPSLIITRNDGKEAVIDFSGGVVKHSGNMPVDEFAQVLFHIVSEYYRGLNE